MYELWQYLNGQYHDPNELWQDSSGQWQDPNGNQMYECPKLKTPKYHVVQEKTLNS
jgi:hypothetical protein